jgi:hypothetical protein
MLGISSLHILTNLPYYMMIFFALLNSNATTEEQPLLQLQTILIPH